MAYILIFGIYVGNSGGVAAVEFVDERSCNNAIASVRAASPWRMTFAVCVPKQLEPRP